MFLILQATLLGFALAAPVGPVNVLCFQRTITSGLKQGAVVGAGAALGDAIFGMIGLLGLIQLSDLSTTTFIIVQICGILFLLGMGIYLLKKPLNVPRNDSVPSKGLMKYLSFVTGQAQKGFFQGFLITLSNPATLGGVILGMGALMTPETTHQDKVLLFLGVILGSSLWWCFLISLALFLRRKPYVQKILDKINPVTGLATLLFSIFLGIRLIFSLMQ